MIRKNNDIKMKQSSMIQKAKGEKPIKKEKNDEDAFVFHYTVFCLLYMVGFMVHTRKYHNNEPFACFGHIIAFCFFRHQRDFIFLSYLAFCFYSFYDVLPNGANHHNMVGFVSLVLMPQQCYRCLYPHDISKINEGTRQSLNVVRIMIVIMYFMAGFHKLNTDFLFQPSVSCAYDKIWQYLELMDVNVDNFTTMDQLPWYLVPLPIGVLIKEFVPPLLLLCPSGKVQKYALAALLVLHAILLPVGFADFGSIANSFLWLFVAPTQAQEQSALSLFHYQTHALLFVVFEMVARLFWDIYGDAKKGYLKSEEATLVLFAYSLIWINLFKGCWKTFQGIRIHRPSSLGSWLPVILFTTWTFLPYFGLRTTGTLTMFSNLRTEGAGPGNHLLLGNHNPFKVFAYQEDIVEILYTADEWQDDELLFRGSILPRILFDREMRWESKHGKDNVSMAVQYGEYIYETEDLKNDPDFDIFRHPEPYWSRKFFDFRVIQPPGTPQKCVW